MPTTLSGDTGTSYMMNKLVILCTTGQAFWESLFQVVG
jgi:hypothetical protein